MLLLGKPFCLHCTPITKDNKRKAAKFRNCKNVSGSMNLFHSIQRYLLSYQLVQFQKYISFSGPKFLGKKFKSLVLNDIDNRVAVMFILLADSNFDAALSASP